MSLTAERLKVLRGDSYPLGATVYKGGVNFCVFSKNCEEVELLLFDNEDHSAPRHIIKLDPETNRTFFYWHAFIPGLKQGQLYGFRVYGSFLPREMGYRFNGRKVLVDPYAKAVVTDTYDRQAAIHAGDNCAQAIKSVVVDTSAYDWEGDRPINIPFAKSIIYELHVGGFTKHPNSGVPEHLRGTYAGLILKIPYLKKLGITAVELLPVQQFDLSDAPATLTNYWGYSPIALFAPHNGYGTNKDPINTVREFRDMVKAFHRAGIEVILDVVFNHTAEGDENGPKLSFKGFANKGYYVLEEGNQAHYKNYSGTGNTLKTNLPIVKRMVLDCLRYWVSEMHIDGFRFDLTTVLSRDFHGTNLKDPPVLWEIESDPVLASAKVIAEPWDLRSYQVGFFVGHRWAEWNDRFRDDVRRFMKSEKGMVTQLANRLTGSSDLFGQIERNQTRSINFITCHDGFTVNDLVSYNDKHNNANGENNQDGNSNNYSWNCGAEGPTEIPEINHLRIRQIRNFLTILMISRGVPMILMGDEVRRTQQGNNNAYCQDNEVSWFDWTLVEKEKHLLSFVQYLIQFRRETEIFTAVNHQASDDPKTGSDINWHGLKLDYPDWHDTSHSIALTLNNPDHSCLLHVMINAYWESLTFEVPPLPNERINSWRLIIDTGASSNNIYDPKAAPVIDEFQFKVNARSIVVLMAK